MSPAEEIEQFEELNRLTPRHFARMVDTAMLVKSGTPAKSV